MTETPPSTQPVQIGVIPKDTLRYHGEYPLSDWGSIWKKVFSKLPHESAYGIYDMCIRELGAIPVPPLTFFSQWVNKSFRIVKTEAQGEDVVALYRHDDDFYLIRAVRSTYNAWAEKKQRKPDEPPFPTDG